MRSEIYEMEAVRSPRFGSSLGPGRTVATLLCAWLAVACESPASAPPASSEPDFATPGRELFLENCSPCHGFDGRGHGPLAASLRTPPADLTRIAARNGGEFPEAQVSWTIDGQMDIGAHGTREMPIWGREFAESIPELGVGEEIARGRIWSVVEYLRTIQER